jgi:hypothetical protein
MKSTILLLVLCVLSTTVQADTAVVIYECHINGERVFSDHICAADAVQRDLSVTNRMDHVTVSTATVSKAKKSRSVKNHPASSSDEQDRRRQQCARIQKSRDALIAKMRAGYTAKQDEQLHDRLRKLDNDYFQLRCSSVH